MHEQEVITEGSMVSPLLARVLHAYSFHLCLKPCEGQTNIINPIFPKKVRH